MCIPITTFLHPQKREWTLRHHLFYMAVHTYRHPHATQLALSSILFSFIQTHPSKMDRHLHHSLSIMPHNLLRDHSMSRSITVQTEGPQPHTGHRTIICRSKAKRYRHMGPCVHHATWFSRNCKDLAVARRCIDFNRVSPRSSCIYVFISCTLNIGAGTLVVQLPRRRVICPESFMFSDVVTKVILLSVLLSLSLKGFF
jgi:hypothetical protein